MPSLQSLARRIDGPVTRPMIAKVANLLFAARGDYRRFSVDDEGRWVNRQPGATFVSPDIFTGVLAQVEAKVRDVWCRDYLPKAGDVVIDLGAGFGNEILVFSTMVGPSGRVIAVEAHPDTFASLRSTVQRSGRENVVPIQAAVTDCDGTLRLADDADHVANSIITDGPSVEVAAMTLDTLVHNIGLERIDLLKINIEGAEREVMKAMTKSVGIIRNIVIECHDFIADDGGSDRFRTKFEVTAALEAFGFKVRERNDAAIPYLRDTITASR